MSGFQRTFNILFITISILLDISAILLNGLIAYLIKKHKKTSFIPFWFIYCLSICDIIVGITGLVFHLSLPTWSLASHQPSWSLISVFAFIVHHYFIQISGELILAIAIDRYINMKYLKKYSTVMTKSRAWYIIVFCIAFGIVAVVPVYTLSEERRAAFDLGINAFRVCCTFFIYVMYVKTYIIIRRRHSSLQSGTKNKVAPSHEPEKIFEYQSKQSNTRCTSESLEVKLSLDYDSFERPKSYLSCTSEKRASFFPPKNIAFISPQYFSTSPAKVACKREETNGKTGKMPCDVENLFNNWVADSNAESVEVMKVRQVTNTKCQFAQVDQKLQTRMPSPEQDFLKAVLFIFLALFICYLPFFIYMLYMHATKRRNAILEAISLTAVLLNSSVNAIILIAFSKDMQRNIKAVFAK